MLNINKIWQSILKEDVSTADVSDAIDNKYRVLITYDDEKYHKIGPRLIEPYAVGLTKAGNPCMRCFQYYGDTKRGVPKWKLMRLDRIQSWQAKTNDHFVAEPRHLGVKTQDYNENGDGSMITIYNQVSFNNNPRKKEDDITTLDLLRRKKKYRQNNEPLNINDLNHTEKVLLL